VGPSSPELGLMSLRLVFGLLTVAHGVSKARGLRKFADAWALSVPVAVLVMLVQIIGGAMIFLGIGAQIAAAANAGVNAVILYYLIVKAGEPFLAPAQHSWSIGLAYFGMALTIAIGGPGAFSLAAVL